MLDTRGDRSDRMRTQGARPASERPRGGYPAEQGASESCGVVPVVGVGDELVGGFGTPGVDLVVVDRVVVGEDVVEDAPRLLDAVLAGEQQRLAVQSVTVVPLVRGHLVGIPVS